jgi:hypothetical protein
MEKFCGSSVAHVTGNSSPDHPALLKSWQAELKRYDRSKSIVSSATDWIQIVKIVFYPVKSIPCGWKSEHHNMLWFIETIFFTSIPPSALISPRCTSRV